MAVILAIAWLIATVAIAASGESLWHYFGVIGNSFLFGVIGLRVEQKGWPKVVRSRRQSRTYLAIAIVSIGLAEGVTRLLESVASISVDPTSVAIGVVLESLFVLEFVACWHATRAGTTNENIHAQAKRRV